MLSLAKLMTSVPEVVVVVKPCVFMAEGLAPLVVASCPGEVGALMGNRFT